MRIFSLQIWRPRLGHSRCFSTELRPRTRSVKVPIGGSGYVHLDILLSPNAATSPNPNILIYLPPGSIRRPDAKESGSDDQHTFPTLLSTLLPKTSIITLNYRISPPTHVFPRPIHDTAIAFDYILRNFLLHRATPHISLLGSRIGGTLATTLALTASNRIHSVAVSEPILDWVGLDAGNEDGREKQLGTPGRNPPKPRPNQNQQYTSADAESLLSLRSQLFPKPDNYFDPFASPTLFLRAPGRDCPQPDFDPGEATVRGGGGGGGGGGEGGAGSGPRDSNSHGDGDGDDAVASAAQRSMSAPQSTSTDHGDIAVTSKPIKRRKVLRRWPPNGPPEDVQLPHFRVFLGDGQDGQALVLRQQGEELVELMRRVCFYGRERQVAEARVGLEVLGGKVIADGEGPPPGGTGTGTRTLSGLEQGAAKWLAQISGDVV